MATLSSVWSSAQEDTSGGTRWRETWTSRLKEHRRGRRWWLRWPCPLLVTLAAAIAELSPVIVEKFSRSNLPEMEKRKLHLSPGTALFVFVNNTLPQTAQLMGSVYESYKDEGDGFLYLCYSSEKTFG
ncbi:hypothetical protein OsJ_32619 [Oryza sativa Japonica Group]|uniref:Autophagy-related protein n=1 Tax=Oryza sativa subsp. japonica TaxID=39947 RepID=B9G8X2_ORYSJ|nr:hypothetical protein OsJ_32619 [Oryza sativa Japonica Group]